AWSNTVTIRPAVRGPFGIFGLLNLVLLRCMGHNEERRGPRNGHLLWKYEGVGEAHSSVSGGSVSARGVLYVHSAPAALCPHVEWAVAGVVGVPVKLDWEPQPAAPNTYRAELNW